ncbi:CHAT domain-containing protein [Micromonospora sp. WMMD714]|uniref:CHAT domain-containing protein n=1 Tax=Micromonospora sp. WMMD714 TaxID=3016097 RepID=UPI00249A6124|nr:CHAT domain-containing protein [Micromonospora sp. WMMD714]WFE64408.1 tetratricopeptide repeat protein [Micromonospora sp. WMMD714]
MTTGLVLDDSGFEILVAGERVGPRRPLTAEDATLLGDLASRYAQAVQAGADDDVLTGLGRALYGWLDGEQGQVTDLLRRAPTPLTFEVQGPRTPSDRQWTVLRAPFELLARPDGGFLAADALLRFGVVRRLGAPGVRPALDAYRLGLGFMAAAPRGQHELDFEAEEAAILRAVGEARIDLMVEDTGDPAQLAHRLADLDGLPVLHLSCHGLNTWRPQPDRPGVPALMLEDELGDARPTTATELVGLLTTMPRLVFVSACLTATAADATGQLPPGPGRRGGPDTPAAGAELVAHSLATALVSAGVPAVLGWDGSVGDRSATVFAETLYGRLGDRADLAVAVGDARRALLESTKPLLRADWHLARLWLGPAGGGPVVAGTRRRSLVSAVRGTKKFLDRKQHVPVAKADMFVGRRPELQQSLRALRAGDRAGVLLHGQGRLGKSSLAARIVDRFPDRAVGVVYGDYGALAVLDAVADAVRANPQARDLIARRLPEVRARPEALETVLIDLLTGPCAQAGDGQSPLLLIIDDLEQILQPDPAGPHRVVAESAPVLAAVLRAFDPAETDSRLVLTSRFLFTLGGLESRLAPVQLRPLSEVAQGKLHWRQQALVPPDRQAERAALARRALRVSRGNPGLQDLVVLRLVYSAEVPPERSEVAVADMEAYLRQGDLPPDADVRAFLENLALDELLAQAGPPHVALLRAVTLFDLPVPVPVVDALAGEVGGSTERLRGLGLLDTFPDRHDPRRQAVAVNALAAGRLVPLTEEERAELAAVAVEPLFAAWGGPTPSPRQDLALDLQLTRLALTAGTSPAVVVACGTGAVVELHGGHAESAFRLGKEAIVLLDRHRAAIPTHLLRKVAGAAVTSGDGDAAAELFDRALRQTQDNNQPEAHPLEQARVIAEQATFLINRGELDRAEQLLRHAQRLFSEAGSEQEATVCHGKIALLLYRRGHFDEALHIRRNIELPVYERLGEARETAICYSSIADILQERGNYDEALYIRRNIELPVYQRLGEARETAMCHGDIAEILYRRGHFDEALHIRRNIELPVYERLGEARETAICQGNIADILQTLGEYDEALHIRRDIEIPVYQRLGDARMTALAQGKIADILQVRGDYDGARKLHLKRLKIHEHQGDIDAIASARWGLAQIDLARQNYRSAEEHLAESFRILRHLQRPDGTAVVGLRFGQLLAALGKQEEARQVLEISLLAAKKISATGLQERISEALTSLSRKSSPR